MATSNNTPHDDDLLSAYVDGVGELTPDERRAIEARMPVLRADADATRDLLAALRDLPREGHEPVWSELSRRISDEVGDRAPRAWWRRWFVPVSGVVALAACALLWMHTRVETAPEQPAPSPAVVVPVTAAIAPHEAAAPSANTVWLDGEAVDLGGLEPAALDDALDDAASPDDDIIGGALLPTPDLAWIDDLDTESLALADRWLVARKGT